MANFPFGIFLGNCGSLIAKRAVGLRGKRLNISSLVPTIILIVEVEKSLFLMNNFRNLNKEYSES
jgi:hypothetical protein